MNVKDYIESGILEAYALGLLKPAEMQEVEAVASKNPAVKLQLKAEVEAMGALTKAYSVNPPAHLREQILKAAKGNEPPQQEETKAEKSKTNNSTKFWMIAATFLFLVSTGINFRQYQNVEKLNQELSISQIKIAELESETEVMVARYNKLENNYTVLTHPQTTQFVMKGVEGRDPNMRADVYWNAKSKMVYLNIKSMPAAPEGKVYQLWALKDGQPIDMGVLKGAEGLQMQELGRVPGADAFAVTLEPQGGSVNPTLEEMYVYGEPVQV